MFFNYITGIFKFSGSGHFGGQRASIKNIKKKCAKCFWRFFYLWVLGVGVRGANRRGGEKFTKLDFLLIENFHFNIGILREKFINYRRRHQILDVFLLIWVVFLFDPNFQIFVGDFGGQNKLLFLKFIKIRSCQGKSLPKNVVLSSA
jgi:hypothetical protein